jgi:hypothetical protein
MLPIFSEVSSSGRLSCSGRYQSVQSLDGSGTLDGEGVSRFWTLGDHLTVKGVQTLDGKVTLNDC